MANYDSNYAIAQEISARIGASPIPFDSVYSIALEIYQELGGTEDNFDSVYSILLGILPLVNGTTSDITQLKIDVANLKIEKQDVLTAGDNITISNNVISSNQIDDTQVLANKTWSSEKINEEFSALEGTANSEIEGKDTVDFTFVDELPQSGEEGQYVVIHGDNHDTLYQYVSDVWTEVVSPDANILYFDVENEALYSYVVLDSQFAPVSLVNTIVVGSNLNSNAQLKALKTPGVYNVVQRLTNKTKGDYVKNWTLYVENVDYEEYDKSDSVYQRLVNNYTIQKRTWSATRSANDGWGSFSTYYAGEIKDSTTSKYYTWSSSKIVSEIAAAGFEVQIVQSLPQSGENHTIYFVPATDTGETNYYDEFMWVDSSWEKIGSTEIDLSNYYTRDEAATTAEINALFA